MAVERAYQYSYIPQREAETFPQREVEIKHKKKSNTEVKFNIKARTKTISLMVVIGCFFALMVIAMAFATSMAYTNSQLEKTNKGLMGDVQGLKAEIQSQINVGTIEEIASGSLGMVYPVGDQFVQITNKCEVDNFAQILKEEAFN